MPRVEKPSGLQSGRQAFELNVQQFCCAGSTLATTRQLPHALITTGGRSATRWAASRLHGSGCRVPHFWLRDGRSLYDALGSDYTLLRTRDDAKVDGLMRAQDRGVPMKLLELGQEALRGTARAADLPTRPTRGMARRR